MTCNCKELLMQKLCSIPSAWRSQIADVLCDANKGLEIPEETLTKLGDWNINYSPEICIAYTDEEGVTVNRCFDFSHLLNQQLDLAGSSLCCHTRGLASLWIICKNGRQCWTSCAPLALTKILLSTKFYHHHYTTPVASGVLGKVYFGAKDTNDVSQADVAATTEYQVDAALPISFRLHCV
jgi:hypothetical protein